MMLTWHPCGKMCHIFINIFQCALFLKILYFKKVQGRKCVTNVGGKWVFLGFQVDGKDLTKK